MRIRTLLFTAGLALASASAAAASPAETCTSKTWIGDLMCRATHEAAQARADARPPAEESDATATSAGDTRDAWSMVRALLRPHTALDWFRDQLGKDTMISSSARPSTRPAATAPSEATRRKDGTPAGARSP